ncbi:hypothetical protein SODALDRAFT_363132 [Sodiomyces alkalinus F11]|uniref:Uncharacterized protein n=1 Tax=Sodiomyces alkalinus (strain CBS 110278 / VKM F-3762 / F11) TaxID=1314773 RepID=A0A3N2PLT3_SODAK|nr:hypothetical protein SODALDRAFT_363132 [Sodiomyces alkalinus F11]ROT35316.1 hypothetical protein SODALDRAFT_363132 [Sodiomyces alkalinus F11]
MSSGGLWESRNPQVKYQILNRCEVAGDECARKTVGGREGRLVRTNSGEDGVTGPFSSSSINCGLFEFPSYPSTRIIIAALALTTVTTIEEEILTSKQRDWYRSAAQSLNPQAYHQLIRPSSSLLPPQARNKDLIVDEYDVVWITIKGSSLVELHVSQPETAAEPNDELFFRVSETTTTNMPLFGYLFYSIRSPAIGYQTFRKVASRSQSHQTGPAITLKTPAL